MDDTSNSSRDDLDTSTPSESASKVDSIRREALNELGPLVDSIDAPVERKFELAMSAVRANFNEDLLQKALDYAKKIEDPTAKAEALIDIVEEANYQEGTQSVR